MENSLHAVLIFLTAAVLVVILCRQFKLPAMLGYLLVGLLIGPHGLALIADNEDTRALAEFGVVFLMFSIGLEFSLSKLMTMRRIVFGLGASQVALTLALCVVVATAFGAGWRAGLAGLSVRAGPATLLRGGVEVTGAADGFGMEGEAAADLAACLQQPALNALLPGRLPSATLAAQMDFKARQAGARTRHARHHMVERRGRHERSDERGHRGRDREDIEVLLRARQAEDADERGDPDEQQPAILAGRAPKRLSIIALKMIMAIIMIITMATNMIMTMRMVIRTDMRIAMDMAIAIPMAMGMITNINSRD